MRGKNSAFGTAVSRAALACVCCAIAAIAGAQTPTPAPVLCQYGTFTLTCQQVASAAACAALQGTVVASCPTPGTTTPTPTPTPTSTQQYCHLAGGECAPYTPGQPVKCTGTVNNVPCQTPTPTPTPTPAVTATPTPTPAPAITFTLLPDDPLGGTYYRQAESDQQLPDGSWLATSNAGHRPGESGGQPLGQASTELGECAVAILYPADGSQPLERAMGCTGQTTDEWEHSTFVCIPQRGGSSAVQCYSNLSLRHGDPGWGNAPHAVQLEALFIPKVADLFVPGAFRNDMWRRDALTEDFTIFWARGWAQRQGQPHLYVQRVDMKGQSAWCLIERLLVYDSGTLAPVAWAPDETEGVSQVVSDTDNTLMAFAGTWPPTTSVSIWRSTDEGLTWKDTGATITAPQGYIGISDCHAAVGAGGEVLKPLWGTCQTFTGLDWSKAGDWHRHLWAQAGAKVPSNFTQTPKLVTP